MNKLLESYINGNISYVRQQLINAPYSLSEMLDQYITEYNPDINAIQLFIRRLSTD